MAKPITPDEVVAKKLDVVRPEIIEAANELIAKHWNGNYAKFTLDELCQLSRKKLKMEKGQQFEDGELDIEPIFRKAGWKVDFDRPGYNETYPATFEFTKRRTRSDE